VWVPKSLKVGEEERKKWGRRSTRPKPVKTQKLSLTLTIGCAKKKQETQERGKKPMRKTNTIRIKLKERKKLMNPPGKKTGMQGTKGKTGG